MRLCSATQWVFTAYKIYDMKWEIKQKVNQCQYGKSGYCENQLKIQSA